MTMGSSTTEIFGDLDCHVFRKVRDNAVSILRQTDGQTDGRHAISIPHYALVHRAVMIKKLNQ